LEHARLHFSDGSNKEAIGARGTVSVPGAVQRAREKRFLFWTYKEKYGSVYSDKSLSATLVYQAHTHGRGTQYTEFSDDDMAISRRFGVPVFMTNETGDFQVYIAGTTPGNEGHILCRACIPVR
jgi:hypothetical protein